MLKHQVPSIDMPKKFKSSKSVHAIKRNSEFERIIEDMKHNIVNDLKSITTRIFNSHISETKASEAKNG